MKRYLALVLVLLNYKLLYLFPWVHLEGKFNITDVTIFLIVLWMVYLLAFRADVFFNHYAFLIFALLIVVGFHIPYAMIQYNITLKDAVIASRVYLLYLSYFVFLDLFEDKRAAEHFLNGILVISAVAVLIGLVNYIGPDLLHHRWATLEGQRMRGGIVRAFFPAFWLILYASLYAFSRFINNDRYSHGWLAFWVVSLGAVLFRQTRMIIGTYGVVAGMNLVRRMGKKRAWLVTGFGAACLLLVVLNLNQLSIARHMVDKTENELIQSSGSWGGRVEQLKTTWKLLSRHYLVGSGTSALRTNIEAYEGLDLERARELVAYAANSDLGYAVWLKNFGLFGAFLLMTWVCCILRDIRYLRQHVDMPGLIDFAANYLLYVAISFFTLNHLGKSDGIVLFTSVLAVLQMMRDQVGENALQPLPASESETAGVDPSRLRPAAQMRLSQ